MFASVILGWVDTRNDGCYLPSCDPPHSAVLRALAAQIEYGMVHNLRGSLLWRYDPKSGQLVRHEDRSHFEISMLELLGELAEEVVASRAPLETLLAQYNPRDIAEDARTMIERHRSEIRMKLANAVGSRSMLDHVVDFVLNSDIALTGNIRVDGNEYITTRVSGLPDGRVAWEGGRLRIVVPGIPADHPMASWSAMNTHRLTELRYLVGPMLSD